MVSCMRVRGTCVRFVRTESTSIRGRTICRGMWYFFFCASGSGMEMGIVRLARSTIDHSVVTRLIHDRRHVRVHHVDKDKDDPQLREVLAQRPEGGSRGRRRRVSDVG